MAFKLIYIYIYIYVYIYLFIYIYIYIYTYIHINTYVCIYIYKVSHIHSFFVIFNCNVFSALHVKHFEIWKNIMWNWWVDCFIARSIKWCDKLGAHSESIFAFMQHFISFQKTLIRVIECWRDDDEFSGNNFVKDFLYGKNTRDFLENWLFSEYYCECQLLWWFEFWMLLSTTSKYYYK